MLTVNALVAADSVLIPMQCEYYALEGLSALLDTIEQIRVAANPRLAIEGVLRTMFDPRNNLANEVSAQLIAHFGDKVFRTVIPRNVRLAEAPSFGKPALFHDKESRGALAYLALAGEMIRREEEASSVARTDGMSAAAATPVGVSGAPAAASAPDATHDPSGRPTDAHPTTSPHPARPPVERAAPPDERTEHLVPHAATGTDGGAVYAASAGHGDGAEHTMSTALGEDRSR